MHEIQLCVTKNRRKYNLNTKIMSEHKEAADSEALKKYPLKLVRGLFFPAPIPLISDIEKTLDFEPLETDIFVVTYPKCGTTWLQFIVWEITHKGAVPPSPNQMMFRDCPFLEFTGVEILEEKPHPRTMKTHFPFNLQPYNSKAKYVYAVRNPWDCCVSYYYHHKFDPSNPQLTFDEYFELFITGELGWGDFFDHVLSWFEHRNDPNVLFLTYESLKKDKKKAILGIAKFLGDTYHEDLNKPEILENCMKHTDFEYMKGLGMFFPAKIDMGLDHITAKTDTGLENINFKDFQKVLGEIDRKTADSYGFDEVNFFRKGEVGDWKNHFSTAQIKQFNEYMLRKLKDTEMENFWQPLLEETTL